VWPFFLLHPGCFLAGLYTPQHKGLLNPREHELLPATLVFYLTADLFRGSEESRRERPHRGEARALGTD
jgi:hypothetical protein